MGALAVTNPTLLDLSKKLDPSGKIDTIVEMLSETNEILGDMTFQQGNLPTGHRTTVRTGLPAPTWRKLYQGVLAGKSTTAQVTDNCGSLEAYAEVDRKLADLSGDAAAFRLSEDRAFLEGMNKEFAQTLFYGNEGTEPEAFTGLAPRFNAKTTGSPENASNVLLADASASGLTQSSIWLVVWGPNTAFGIIPKGSTAGFTQEDKGIVTAGDATNGYWEAYRTHYKWDVGLTVRDWRYIVRIANIDLDNITKTGTGSDLIDMMAQASEIVPSLGLGRPVFYCNRTIKSWLRRQIVNKVAASTLTMDQVAGKHVMTFDSIPVRRCDAILNTEAVVV